MRWFPISPYVTLPVVALVAIVQSTVTSRVGLFGVCPNLVLLFAISWVLLRGVGEGLFISLVGGLVLDALSGGPFGLASLSLCGASYLAGFGEFNVFRTARLLPYAAIAVATLVYHGMFLFLSQMTGRAVWWGASLGRIVLPAMGVNLLAMPVVYGLCHWVLGRIEPERAEWE